MRQPNAVFASCGTSIFETVSRWAREHGAVNLGQGFPDGRGCEEVLARAAAELIEGNNQYPPMLGLPVLRRAVAAHDERFYGITVDPEREVMVTSGATEALAACFLGLLEPGDEVVLLDPVYDSYIPLIRRAGGVPRVVRLRPPDWRLPREELAAAFGPRTKLLVLNTPMNPTGKVFDEGELGLLAELLLAHDCYAVCDEVYEHLVFGAARHTSLMTLPGMRSRCLKLGSAGKTFSLTGFKVGYVTAPPSLIEAVMRAHQYLVFATPPNLQAAVAHGLGLPGSYFAGLGEELESKRERLARGLSSVGFEVLPAASTYFLLAGYARLEARLDDLAFCERLTREAKVAAIPLSGLCADGAATGYVRLCFAKHDDVLDRAVTNLAGYFRHAT